MASGHVRCAGRLSLPDKTLDDVPPRWRVVLGSGTVALGAGLALLGLGAFRVPDESFLAPRWIIVLVGGLTLFMGGTFTWSGIRDLRSPAPEGARSALPRWLAWLLGASIATGLGIIATWAGLGPGERAFSGGITGSPLEGRIVFTVLGLATDALAVWIWVWGIRRIRRGEEP